MGGGAHESGELQREREWVMGMATWVWQPAKDLCLKLWRGFFQEERKWRGGECEDHEEEHEEGREEHEGHKKREEGHEECEEHEERGT